MDQVNIALKLPDFRSHDIILKRVTELKLLGAMIHENLNWKSLTNCLKTKSQKILESYLKVVYT